jgi:antitoxin YefM
MIMINDEDEGLLETCHLLRNPANAKHLIASIAEADAGKFVTYDLIEKLPGNEDPEPR